MRRPNRRRRSRLGLPLLLSCALAACSQDDGGKSAGRETIGLYTSLPIAWPESDDVRALVSQDAAPSWVLTALRSRGKVVVLDTLADDAGTLSLPASGLLVLAQPRPLTPRENVALDAWVRGGGHVLLFVDPMLTAHSIFSLGDPRRPQDVAMLSPILERWGLRLEFDDTQPVGERRLGGIPVNLTGRFVVPGKSGEAVARCRLDHDGLLARCNSGKGRVTAIADAALLEDQGTAEDITVRRSTLAGLLDTADQP